ncbi:hypothetical protein QUB67_01410 [Microcoleus sp. ARI1-A1]
MINLDLPQSDPFNNLNVTLLLQALTSGQVVASVFEFPDCRVKAETLLNGSRTNSCYLLRTAQKYSSDFLQPTDSG